MKDVFRIIVTLATLAAFSGCNTMEGVGKDLKKGGEAIEKKAADKAR